MLRFLISYPYGHVLKQCAIAEKYNYGKTLLQHSKILKQHNANITRIAVYSLQI